MVNFVLVHGAWHGAWCWRYVVREFVLQGHHAHPVTLTGVGERKHLMSPLITLETHISDVANTIEAGEMDDIVLAVHSYAGMLGTAIADRMPHCLRHLVYIDAVVPKPGESWSSTHTNAMQETRLAAMQASSDFSLPPPDPSIYGLKNEAYEWVKRRQTPHPGHTYLAPLQFDPTRVSAVPRTFIDCTQPPLGTIDVFRRRVRDASMWNGAWLGGAGVRVVELRTVHDAMVSEPHALSRILLECAGDSR